MAKKEGNLFVNYKLLGQHIQEVRRSRSISQEALAEALDVSVGHIGKVERGERYVNLERLAEISLFLKVPIEELIAGCIEAEKDFQPVVNPQLPEILTILHTLLKGQPQKVMCLAVSLVSEVVKAFNESDIN